MRLFRRFPLLEVGFALALPLFVGARWLQHRADLAAKRAQVKADVDKIAAALEVWIQRIDRFPQTLDELVQPPSYLKVAPVLEALPRDPWGHDYAYSPPCGDETIMVTSYGLDGVPGGTGESADINLRRDFRKPFVRSYVVRIERALEDFDLLQHALERFRMARGSWPRTLDELVLAQESGLMGLPLDPWGNAYAYWPPLDPYTPLWPTRPPRSGKNAPQAEVSQLLRSMIRDFTPQPPPPDEGTEAPYQLVSYGCDGAPGGQGTSQDLTAARLAELRRDLTALHAFLDAPGPPAEESDPEGDQRPR